MNSSTGVIKGKTYYIYKEVSCRRNISVQKNPWFRRSASGKFASYLNLRKRRFCAIQLGAHRNLIKYGNGSSTSMLPRCSKRSTYVSDHANLVLLKRHDTLHTHVLRIKREVKLCSTSFLQSIGLVRTFSKPTYDRSAYLLLLQYSLARRMQRVCGNSIRYK